MAESLELRVLLSSGRLEPLDPSFDRDGVVTTNFGPGSTAWASDLLVQPDQKILVSGGTFGETFPLRRFDKDGSPDPDFGNGGQAVQIADPARRINEVHALALDSTGRILAAGAWNTGGAPPSPDFIVARFNPDGTPDPTFGGGGAVVTDLPFAEPGFESFAWAQAVLVQADGKIVVGGNSGAYWAAVRYNPDGSLDAGFGDGGMAQFGGEGSIRELMLQPDGKVVATGETVIVEDSPLGPMAVPVMSAIRFDGGGNLDPGFGDAGRVKLAAHENGYPDNGWGWTGALRPDGRILVGGGEQPRDGWTVLPAHFALYSLKPDGSLDDTFADGGGLRSNFGDAAEFNSDFRDMLLRPDGSVVLAGSAADGEDVKVALAAYDEEGQPVRKFGTNGTIMWTSMRYAEQIELDARGHVLLAGGANDSTTDTAIARYVPFPSIKVGNDGGEGAAPGAVVSIAAAVAADDSAPSFFVRRTGDLSIPVAVYGEVAGVDGAGMVVARTSEVFVFGRDQDALEVPARTYGRLLLGGGAGSLRLTVTDARGHELLSAGSAEVPFSGGGGGSPAVVVAGRRVFYNDSSYDGNGPAVDARDALAVAPDKGALLPGGSAVAEDYTSYAKGINGIMIDFAGMSPQAAAALTPADFVFRTGTATGNSVVWRPVAADASLAVVPSPFANDSTRVAIIWPNGTIRDAWLEVTVKADANTGLAAADVFSFGNLVGDATGDQRVNALDLGAVKRAINAPAGLTSGLDLNRDGKVNALDLGIIKANLNKALSPVTGTAATTLVPATASPFFRAMAVNLSGETSPRRVWQEQPVLPLG